jgi:uncharacterized protein (DUF2235 family)
MAQGPVPSRSRSAAHREPKNIVICCDGTGNQITGDHSNVLKLFRMATKDEAQRVFYDPGVGTIGTDDAWQRLRTNARAIFGLVTGAGLDENVLDAYKFIVENWERDDKVFLFGFSRGAYTVRELAGFLHVVGLLRPDQLNLCEYALTAYKKSGWRSEEVYDEARAQGEEPPAPLPAAGTGVEGARSARPSVHPVARREGPFAAAWEFARATGTRHVPIHFMGCWDTVASMIVPGPKLVSMPRLRTLPYTRFNPSVRAFRHAMAVDERRRMFRLNWWKDGQKFVSNPFSHPPAEEPQDCVQRWFPGVHSDVGGGYAEEQSSLSKWPLIWMVTEAVGHGLRIGDKSFQRLAWGKEPDGSPSGYMPPNAAGPAHRSLHGAWWALEFLPKQAKWREWRKAWLGFYLPRGEPRVVDPTAVLSDSARQRLEATGGPGPGEDVCKGCDYPPYRPVNLVEPRRSWLPPLPTWQRILSKVTVPLAWLPYLALLGLLIWGIVWLLGCAVRLLVLGATELWHLIQLVLPGFLS